MTVSIPGMYRVDTDIPKFLNIVTSIINLPKSFGEGA